MGKKVKSSKSKAKAKRKSLISNLLLKKSKSHKPSMKEKEEKTSKELWLEEERLALEELAKEKQQFISKPNKHSLYEQKWAVFWKKKQKELGGKIKVEDLKEEWRQVWIDYLDSEYRGKRD